MIGVKITHTKMMTAEIDAHYMGNLINGGRLMDYWGDVATELMIRATGDGSLFRAYKEAEFLAPIHVGDFMEYTAWIESRGNTSFVVKFEAWKTITHTDDYKISRKFTDAIMGEPDLKGYEGRLYLEKPILCGTATGIMVVPKELQKLAPDPRFRVENA